MASGEGRKAENEVVFIYVPFFRCETWCYHQTGGGGAISVDRATNITSDETGKTSWRGANKSIPQRF